MRLARPAASARPAATSSLPRRVLLGGLALAPLTLTACNSEDPSAPAGASGSPAERATADADLLRAHDLEGSDARTIIDRLEALPLAERPAELMASVLPDSLELSDTSGRTAVLPLPEGEAYVSIAPFVTTTHECFFHSLTTCLGELPEEEVHVQLTPSAAGSDGDEGAAALIDELRRTAPNGFLGLWLPRGEEFTLELSADGLRASTALATTAEAPTCVTTMQLGA